jgi:hypothetical protein
MRPLVLAGIVAALTGCSLPYVGTKFEAMPKFESSTEGGHREVGDPTDNNEQSGAAHMAAHGSGQGGNLYAPDQDDNLSSSAGQGRGAKKLGQTPVVFPYTAKPSGQVTMNPTENKNAPQPRPIAEESGHESVQGESEHRGD